MLIDRDGNPIDQMVHQEAYRRWCDLLDESDREAIIDAIHSHMDGENSFVSSHIPGPEWEGTPYLPIYIACDEDADEAALFFGLLVWDAAMRHSARWRVQRAPRSGGVRPPGKLYTRIESEQ